MLLNIVLLQLLVLRLLANKWVDHQLEVALVHQPVQE